jgi:hypothetical protein
VTQRIDPVGPRRDLAPVDQLRALTPVERELEKERRDRERRRRAAAAAKRPDAPGHRRGTPPQSGPERGGLDIRA